jgi:LEA14-like dessication related protein
MKKVLVLLLILLVGISVWSYFHFLHTFKEPVFVGIRDIKVLKVEDQVAEVSAIVVFNNPNEISAKLLNTELKAYSNDVLVGQISQTQLSDIPAATDFEIPFRFSVDLVKLGMSQSISGMVEKLMNEERVIPIRFDGYCRIRNKENTYRIPVSYEDKLVFK